MLADFGADQVELDEVEQFAALELFLDFLIATHFFDENLIVRQEVVLFLIYRLRAIVELQEETLRLHVEELDHLLVAVQVGEDDVEDFADEGLRRLEAHILSLVRFHGLAVGAGLILLVRVDEDDLAEDLLEEELEERGDRSSQRIVLRLLLLLDLLAPAQSDWVHATAVTSLEHAEHVEFGQEVQVLALVVPDQSSEHRADVRFRPARLDA